LQSPWLDIERARAGASAAAAMDIENIEIAFGKVS
jgi:hypothetical protein